MTAPKGSLKDIYRSLLERYGPQFWWPAKSRFEMMAGAILTQNTTWTSVEYALANLKRAGILTPRAILATPQARLGTLLRPAGYFNVKSGRLRSISAWLVNNGGHARLNRLDTPSLRTSLLSVHGVGPETADAILLYAFKRPVFVVDAYTRRIFTRVGVLGGGEPYEVIRGQFEKELESLPPVYNEYHALIVEHAKRACRKIPHCDTCCIRNRCEYATKNREVNR